MVMQMRVPRAPVPAETISPVVGSLILIFGLEAPYTLKPRFVKKRVSIAGLAYVLM